MWKADRKWWDGWLAAYEEATPPNGFPQVRELLPKECVEAAVSRLEREPRNPKTLSTSLGVLKLGAPHVTPALVDRLVRIRNVDVSMALASTKWFLGLLKAEPALRLASKSVKTKLVLLKEFTSQADLGDQAVVLPAEAMVRVLSGRGPTGKPLSSDKERLWNLTLQDYQKHPHLFSRTQRLFPLFSDQDRVLLGESVLPDVLGRLLTHKYSSPTRLLEPGVPADYSGGTVAQFCNMYASSDRDVAVGLVDRWGHVMASRFCRPDVGYPCSHPVHMVRAGTVGDIADRFPDVFARLLTEMDESDVRQPGVLAAVPYSRLAEMTSSQFRLRHCVRLGRMLEDGTLGSVQEWVDYHFVNTPRPEQYLVEVLRYGNWSDEMLEALVPWVQNLNPRLLIPVLGLESVYKTPYGQMDMRLRVPDRMWEEIVKHGRHDLAKAMTVTFGTTSAQPVPSHLEKQWGALLSGWDRTCWESRSDRTTRGWAASEPAPLEFARVMAKDEMMTALLEYPTRFHMWLRSRAIRPELFWSMLRAGEYWGTPVNAVTGLAG